MAQKEAAAALASLLSKVARYSVILGIGGSALQTSLYTGVRMCWSWPSRPRQPQPAGPQTVDRGTPGLLGLPLPRDVELQGGLEGGGAAAAAAAAGRSQPPAPPLATPLQSMAASGR